MLQRCQPLSKSPPDGVKAALWLSALAVGAQLRGSDDGRLHITRNPVRLQSPALLGDSPGQMRGSLQAGPRPAPTQAIKRASLVNSVLCKVQSPSQDGFSCRLASKAGSSPALWPPSTGALSASKLFQQHQVQTFTVRACAGRRPPRAVGGLYLCR